MHDVPADQSYSYIIWICFLRCNYTHPGKAAKATWVLGKKKNLRSILNILMALMYPGAQDRLALLPSFLGFPGHK